VQHGAYLLLLCSVGRQRMPQSRPAPCRSQPSLVESKLVVASEKNRKKASSSVSQDKPHSAGSSRLTRSKPNPNIPVSRTRSKPDVSSTVSKRTEAAVQRMSKPATSIKSEGTTKSSSNRQVDPLLSSPRSRRRQLADENIDVTTYLLHRMLGAPAQLPEDSSQLINARQKTAKDTEDKHSDAGTYTIDEEEDADVKQTVQEARERIDAVFGISDATENKTEDASSRLVRPVIEQDHIGTGSVEVDADEDVFIDDEAHRQHYVSCFLILLTVLLEFICAGLFSILVIDNLVLCAFHLVKFNLITTVI